MCTKPLLPGKRVQALAGAKNHSIVMPTADLDATVTQIVSAAFGSAGERRMACSVVVAVGEVAEPALKLKQAADEIIIGNGADEGSSSGRLSGELIRSARSYIEAGEQEGAKLVRDGRSDEAVKGTDILSDRRFLMR